MARHTYSRVIRFADTDAAGVVYFAQVLTLCHEAYEEALATAGIDVKTFFSRGAIAVPIVHAEVDFRHPLYCGDAIRVVLTPTGLNDHKFAIAYEIFCQETLAATAETVHVCIDPVKRRPHPLSEGLRRWLGLAD